MLTNNFRRLAIAGLKSQNYSNYININGEIVTGNSNFQFGTAFLGQFGFTALSTLSDYKTCIGLGTGNKELSADDYTLDQIYNDDNTNLSKVASSYTNTCQNQINGQHILSMTFLYSGEEPVTFTEIGLFGKISQTTTSIVLFARDLITPITVNPQDQFTVTMTISG